ncbi:MAG TPA: hypothetical protein VIG99_30140 [Myxococcaceae bacterium]
MRERDPPVVEQAPETHLQRALQGTPAAARVLDQAAKAAHPAAPARIHVEAALQLLQQMAIPAPGALQRGGERQFVDRPGQVDERPGQGGHR